MNRRDRRIAEKKGQPAPRGAAPSDPRSPLPTMPIVGDAGKPSLLLRIVARLLLSRFVINRVHQPYVLEMLSDVARQSGRMEAVLRIQAKLLADKNS